MATVYQCCGAEAGTGGSAEVGCHPGNRGYQEGVPDRRCIGERVGRNIRTGVGRNFAGMTTVTA